VRCFEGVVEWNNNAGKGQKGRSRAERSGRRTDSIIITAPKQQQ
jgi:hypothetical protein